LQVAVDSKGIEGWDHVCNLASFLADLDTPALSNSQADEICQLHDALIEYDKMQIVPDRTKGKQPHGRFKAKRTCSVTPSAELSQK
jgi:hypothetical protein